MSTALTTTNGADIIERVVIVGDLSKLQPHERVDYYRAVCESVGLNPLTKPFDYINLQGRLTLYARKDATDQLRRIHRVSIAIVDRERVEDVYVVTARATTADGRTDESTGAVNMGALKGDALANALMKAETKAKRRVTLSICGLGWLDETEIATIPDARPVAVDQSTGEIINGSTHAPRPERSSGVQRAPIDTYRNVVETDQMLQHMEQPKGERPLVKRLRELVGECRAAGVVVPDLPRPRDMTDEQLGVAIADLEAEYALAHAAADAAKDELFPDMEAEYDAIDATAR